MRNKADDDAEFEALLNALSPERKKDREKSPLPIRGENVNFSLQAPPSTEQAQAAMKPAYLTADEYTRIKVRHWKEGYILPEIDNPVAVGLYALFRAYHAEKGNFPLNIQTRYIYRREDTGKIISAEERKQLRGNIRTSKISYGLRELYRRSGGGSSDYQLMKALEQLTAQGYLFLEGTDSYTVSTKQPERLFNADEFISFANGAGISLAIYGYGRIRLNGNNETAKSRLQRMLDYSDTLRVTLIYRLKGEPVFYDWE